MAPSEHPDMPPERSETPATAGIQTPPTISAPAEAASISLPPLPQPPAMEPAKFLRLRGGLDAALIVVVLLFAFLAASFPAGNSDFFRQLATGRLLLQGEYHFGVDPFVYSAAEGDYFVNHSWLFALLMYGLYHLPAVGGAAVVIFKALLVVALAEILLRVSRRPGQSLWVPAACTALALLVVSPHLHLRPMCLSLLFLGVTLWLLTVRRPNGKHFWWLLPPLFALWVNCDSWFFLGPLTVALYLVGEGIQQWQSSRAGQPDRSRQGELGTLGLVLLIGLAACLLNPHHVHAFTLPPEFGLTSAGDLIELDPQFRALYLSPLRKEYYEPYLGLSVAGLAYWPLLLLGLASFVLVFGRAPWWRLPVWVGFALMSLYNIRAMPFFAIVAGPITALNWLDYAAQRLGVEPRLTTAWRNWSLGGRALTLLLGLALLIATVPGWLQSQPQDNRRLGWSVHVDPSLQAMAETIRGWRQDQLLDQQDTHWFSMYSEVANYLAWFAPGEHVFLDTGLPYFRKAAEDYLSLCRSLEALAEEQPNAEGESIALKKLQQWLHQHRVRYWIFDNLRGQKAHQVARALLFTRPQEWVLCAWHGRIAIFAWRDPHETEAADPSPRLKLNLKKAAFGREAEPAPPRGSEPTPPKEWWETCWDVWRRPALPPSLDREAAALYDFRFQILEEPQRRQQVYLHSHAWQAAVAAGAIASSLRHGPVPNSLLALSWSSTYHDLFPPGAMQPARDPSHSEAVAIDAWLLHMNRQPLEPPTSLYLGIRAARRALLVDPEDGLTYLRLGQAYERLRDQPQERAVRDSAPHLLLLDIRRTQMVAAFHNCLRLQPDPHSAAQAHEALFKLYAPATLVPFGLDYIDAAVHHRREALNLWTALGPPPGMSATRYNQQLDRLSADLVKLDAELERRRNSYDVRTVSKSGLEKVKVALELRLTDTALAALEEAADAKVSTQDDMRVVKQVTAVALDLGRLDRARELLVPDPESMAGQPVRPDYLALHVRLAAGRGDYAEADRLLADALRHAWQPPPGQLMLDPALRVALLVGRVLLGEGQRLAGTPCMPWLPNDPKDIFQRPWLFQNPSDFWIRSWRMQAIVHGLNVALVPAEEHLIRGWLALEAGHCVEARTHFEKVRDLTVRGENWVPEVNQVNGWLNPEKEIRSLRQLDRQHGVLHDLSKRYLNWLVEEQ